MDVALMMIGIVVLGEASSKRNGLIWGMLGTVLVVVLTMVTILGRGLMGI